VGGESPGRRRRLPAGVRAEDPVAYLYRCVRNTAQNHSRASRRRRNHESTAGRQRPFAIEDRETETLSEEVESALADLPIEQREVVVLKIWSGLTYETIGQVLSIPLGTAQSRYRYAVQAMRQRLAESPWNSSQTGATMANADDEFENEMWRLRPRELSPDVAAEIRRELERPPDVSIKSRRRLAPSMAIAAAIVAGVVAAVSLWPTDTARELDDVWTITPVGTPVFEVIDHGRIRLTSGELHVQSVSECSATISLSV
jgi:hypothetical protein